MCVFIIVYENTHSKNNLIFTRKKWWNFCQKWLFFMKKYGELDFKLGLLDLLLIKEWEEELRWEPMADAKFTYKFCLSIFVLTFPSFSNKVQKNGQTSQYTLSKIASAGGIPLNMSPPR